MWGKGRIDELVANLWSCELISGFKGQVVGKGWCVVEEENHGCRKVQGRGEPHVTPAGPARA